MARDRPRFLRSQRDMILSLAPLLLLCLAFAGLVSQCQFSPGGPTQGRIPDFDVHAALRSDADSLSFPVRDPEVPSDWRPNSGSQGIVRGGRVASTVGFITPPGHYIQLTQSDADADDLVSFVVGQRAVTGSREVAGRRWAIYAEPGSEQVWVTDFGPVRALLRGSADDAEYSTLAAAVGAASPVRP